MRQKETAVQSFIKYLILFMFSALILTACGGTGKESGGAESGGVESEKERIAYVIRETDVPDPDETLAALVKGTESIDSVWEQDYQFVGDKLYRLVQLLVKTEGSDDLQVQNYMQVLASPYETWKNYRIPVSYWDEAEVYEVYIPREVVAVEKDKVYLKVRYWDGTHHLGVWSEDGPGGLLSVLPEELWEANIVIGDGMAVGAYKMNQNYFWLLDQDAKEVQIKGRIAIPGSIVGALWNPQSRQLLWHGFDEDRKTGLWRTDDDAAVARLPEGKGNISLAACSDGGVLYLANAQDLWRCDEKGEPESLCHFFEQDYPVETLYGMSVQAEDTLLLLARYEGKDHVLQVTKGEGGGQEKLKIVLASDMVIQRTPLGQAITKFNRRNQEYRVEVIEREENESINDFWDRIQREMLTGRGPDLFLGMHMNAEDFVENGYLQEVTDFLPEEGVLWQAALENGVIHGRQYGIPYECRLSLAVYSQELTGGRDSWTLDEMMEAVRNSDAEILEVGLSGANIVMTYGLYDNDSRKFIDWENGESHLDEAPFLDFLAFAKEYADKENSSEEPDTRLLEGKVAAKSPFADLSTLGDLNGLEASFQGKPAYIGFPREEGNGIYVKSRNFYVSVQTEQREGCRAFLDFILSEEMQKDYVEFEWLSDPFMPMMEPRLPVRLSALERSILLKKQEKGSDFLNRMTEEGIMYSSKGFSEEQEAAFRFLLENARPANWLVQEIMGMVYEELQPYFAEQRTAEDAAEILNRRIQLYLDERK